MRIVSSNLKVRSSIENEETKNNARVIARMDTTSTEDIRLLENEIKEGLKRSADIKKDMIPSFENDQSPSKNR